MARAIFGTHSRTSNATPSGIPQGTMGGRSASAGARPGLKLNFGDEVYLWILVALEVLAIGLLRQRFRRYHGG